MTRYTSSQKLWKIIEEPTGYFYEIKLHGIVIDRIRIEEPTLKNLKKWEVI